ncbi:centromere protein R isoform X2 [Psammomys obesus]|uniref:centromere protein R isoform X2 n=1 Tax=Psammomys obesus TaxID=48139 RepID=UPI00245288DB|nr:centromere protein R isoform X2 [Psammomys obesus]
MLPRLRFLNRFCPATVAVAKSPEMPVKRSLKLDDMVEENSFGPSKITRKKSITAYSPTTGTYQMSPFSSPTTPKEQEHRNGPSNETRKLNSFSSPAGKESIAKDSDEFMTLLSTIERSSEKTVEIMKNLSSIQALEGNRQLEDLIGISLVPCVLKGEAKKTKELMTKVTKQKLLKKKNSRIPPKEHHLDSFAFLKAILN